MNIQLNKEELVIVGELVRAKQLELKQEEIRKRNTFFAQRNKDYMENLRTEIEKLEHINYRVSRHKRIEQLSH